MRLSGYVFTSILAACLGLSCTKHNPAACCATVDECSSFGLPSITGCEGGQVCDSSGTCVAPQCTSASDCPSQNDCINSFCVPFSAPADLTYSSSDALYTEMLAITDNVPASTGGAIVSYSVSPPLPTGLALDPTTGVISGTPVSYTAITSYTITGVNDTGSAETTISIAITARELLAGGNAFSCARVNGAAMCWGGNADGQLGDDSTSTSPTPLVVDNLHSGVEAIASSATSEHACAIVNGGAQCWGYNVAGQLGNGSNAQSNIPVQVMGLSLAVEDIAVGGNNTCAVLTNGEIECWGTNGDGQLGDDTPPSSGSPIPVPVSGIGSGGTAVVVGNGHACGLVNGGVQCWGFNTVGELGNNTFTSSNIPVPVSGLGSGVQQITAGSLHTCALVNGGVACWGNNSNGELGNNSTNNSPIPVQVIGLTNNVQAIAAGANFTCALVSGGVQCWGANESGELGDNSNNPSSIPLGVSGLTADVQAITAGNEHACALVNQGLMCWGANASGQLGDNDAESDSLVPVPVSLLTGGVQP